ncbi:hypothetical protein PSACC_00722 [Paramicrosporidium saccamoebae]|uniref:Small EDRK-rich factor-like N-terminal domain-containing protein n=1 Tax=Paramicrosporidium saccamoebae TaxID=1246581 RepID=A0A2H9TNX8_9FUNG|nr:hypothetical protein PSACC_00722 [Paramicrosporidium saccamoebae]
MTRGNQREMDRAKNAKKQAGQKKERDTPEGSSVQNVKLQKQVEAEARKASAPSTAKDKNLSRRDLRIVSESGNLSRRGGPNFKPVHNSTDSSTCCRGEELRG